MEANVAWSRFRGSRLVEMKPGVRQLVEDAVANEDNRPPLAEDDRLESLELLVGQVAVAIGQDFADAARGRRPEALHPFERRDGLRARPSRSVSGAICFNIAFRRATFSERRMSVLSMQDSQAV